ncbi:3-hydroxyisobutyrate dehydrogenase [Rhodococcus sp. 14-2496-1d]|uniref:NAD(P)-dependent oxidoreductase n=1 Tax=Rhodococcus sp. 14-2496-1d TaxID=2023146 RepID=UPI000B9AB966|nr:NAD(P)-dependent oxidoreductase [Rhodococcus sp. 14-2496-1d]OZF25704.1 3-hydroxyisobutyrate dehydrogenase [Rhodococcus sp. 14-2496-1d]
MDIGYIGVGNMGGRLARRLQRNYELTVYDRSESAVAALVDAGARGAESAAEVARTCDVVFLCLPTSDHVWSAVLGAGSVAETARPGTIVVDQTTGDPAMSRKIAENLAERDLVFVDAPVSGGPMGADQGTISIMVGAADPDFEKLEPILRVISTNVFHAGGVGSGHVTKLVNNMLSAVHRAVGVEALALAAKNGVDPERALEMILAGSGRNFFLETFGRSHILAGNLDSGFSLGLSHKDVRLACRMGDESGVPMLFGNLVKEFYQMCINDRGPDAGVNTAALVMDRMAGTAVVPASSALDGGTR